MCAKYILLNICPKVLKFDYLYVILEPPFCHAIHAKCLAIKRVIKLHYSTMQFMDAASFLIVRHNFPYIIV